ncbi:amidase [Bradyrhizobium glycinis]|uniref:amidase n=1 Tax=Bradyrhizobium glycinis TaxID=2751812 RepID=UPI0018D9FFA7|nr:amidase [Bradyrhizobium glycinis]MBH5373492.1 amidase [Bradyrhizobium glycinis]
MISLADLKRRIENSELSADAALSQSLQAIDAHEQTVGAFVCRSKEPRAASCGPLRGIAVGVKDIIETSDLPTEMGTSIYKDFHPRADASIVTMLKMAGATVVGKTTTSAFASHDPTTTLNPRNHAHTPGGSSAGSAAAVAAGMIPLALGTQTGGSVIRPASFCGVAAIKPSYRLLPTVGIKCFSWTLDTVGLFAAGVEDLGIALSAITGRPELAMDALSRAPRIGVVTQEFAPKADAESEEALQTAVAAVRRAGASVQRPKLPDLISQAYRIHPVIMAFEAHRALAWEYHGHRGDIAPELRAYLDKTVDIPQSAYDAAQSIALRAGTSLIDAFCDLDVLLTFSAPGAAPKGLTSTGDPRFNRVWTLLGTPCVNVPVIIANGRLPVGVQVIARPGEDATALSAARFIEDALRRHTS